MNLKRPHALQEKNRKEMKDEFLALRADMTAQFIKLDSKFDQFVETMALWQPAINDAVRRAAQTGCNGGACAFSARRPSLTATALCSSSRRVASLKHGHLPPRDVDLRIERCHPMGCCCTVLPL
jgi:hypothetical protein